MEESCIRTDEVADLLDRLVSKSLVVFDAGTSRFHALETVRQYARESLLSDLDRGGPNIHQRHAEHFAQLLNTIGRARGRVALDTVECDYDNFRVAFEWWLNVPDDEHANHMAWLLYDYWYARGMLAEGVARTEAALESTTDKESIAHGRARWSHGDLIMHLGNFDQAIEDFQTALDIAEKHGDKQLKVMALSGFAGMHHDHYPDYHKSRAYRLQALELTKELGDDRRMAGHLYNLGDLVLKHHPDLDDPAKLPAILSESQNYLDESLAIISAYDDVKLTIFIKAALGHIAWFKGEIPLAKKHLAEGLRLSIDSGHAIGESLSLGLLGMTFNDSGDFRTARIFISGAERIFTRVGFRMGVKEAAGWRAKLAENRTHFDDDQLAECELVASRMRPEEFLKLAEGK